MHHTALLYNPLHGGLSHKLNNNSSHYTVYIQIFEGHKFCWLICHPRNLNPEIL